MLLKGKKRDDAELSASHGKKKEPTNFFFSTSQRKTRRMRARGSETQNGGLGGPPVYRTLLPKKKRAILVRQDVGIDLLSPAKGEGTLTGGFRTSPSDEGKRGRRGACACKMVRKARNHRSLH